MLLELYPRVYRRYTSLAVIGPILDGYGTWLLKQGYSTERVREHFCAARRLVPRLQQRGVGALTSLTRARLRACAPADSQEDPNLAVLVRQLDRYCESELVLYPAPALTRIEQRVAAYRTYLQQVRGFAPSTLTHHGRTTSEFLAHIGYETHPTRLATLERQDLDAFVRAVGPRQSRASLQHVVAHLRAFLRFLASAGEIPPGLDTQIDTPRVYRGEKLPRALPWNTVRALLETIDRTSSLGRRDYAIFLLMATYGLRACEVVTLTIDDVEWRAERLRIAQRNEAFQAWSKRSGLAIPFQGPHCVRHSYAVHLLRSGLSLKTIGDLLGHRTLESTCVYLRLAVDDLRDVALSLPVVVDCSAPGVPS